MSNKGFTLIEALLVLSIVAIVTACFPFLKVNTSLQLSYQMKTIYHKLLYAQTKSIAHKKDVSVDFHGNTYQIDGQREILSSSIVCNSIRFHFTALGSISKAGTLTCTLKGDSRNIVLELGSGRMYVK